MSEGSDAISPQSQTSHIKSQSAAWLSRVNAGDWNDASQAELDAWLLESRAHRAAYWRLEAAWQEAERLRVLRTALSRHKVPRESKPRTSVKIVAATVIAVVLGVVAFNQTKSPETRAYATGVGDRQVLKLSDGSNIELNTNTALRISADAGGRKVWLDKGEAFFQITHNAAHPFTVTAGEHKITDLGTKFSVRQEGGRLRVTLLEGRARLDSTDSLLRHQSVELTPGDVAVATATSLSLIRQSDKALTEELGWRRGVLIFDRTSLAKAVAEINRYNKEELIIQDPSIGKLTVDGTFPVRAVPEFTEVAQAVFGLRVERRGGRTLISR